MCLNPSWSPIGSIKRRLTAQNWSNLSVKKERKQKTKLQCYRGRRISRLHNCVEFFLFWRAALFYPKSQNNYFHNYVIVKALWKWVLIIFELLAIKAKFENQNFVTYSFFFPKSFPWFSQTKRVIRLICWRSKYLYTTAVEP